MIEEDPTGAGQQTDDVDRSGDTFTDAWGRPGTQQQQQGFFNPETGEYETQAEQGADEGNDADYLMWLEQHKDDEQTEQQHQDERDATQPVVPAEAPGESHPHAEEPEMHHEALHLAPQDAPEHIRTV